MRHVLAGVDEEVKDGRLTQVITEGVSSRSSPSTKLPRGHSEAARRENNTAKIIKPFSMEPLCTPTSQPKALPLLLPLPHDASSLDASRPDSQWSTTSATMGVSSSSGAGTPATTTKAAATTAGVAAAPASQQRRKNNPSEWLGAVGANFQAATHAAEDRAKDLKSTLEPAVDDAVTEVKKLLGWRGKSNGASPGEAAKLASALALAGIAEGEEVDETRWEEATQRLKGGSTRVDSGVSTPQELPPEALAPTPKALALAGKAWLPPAPASSRFFTGLWLQGFALGAGSPPALPPLLTVDAPPFAPEATDADVDAWSVRAAAAAAADLLGDSGGATSAMAAADNPHLTCGAIVSVLERCAWVVELHFTSCPRLDVDIKSLAALPGLVSINFAGSVRVKGELASLAALPKLRFVDLSFCRGVVGNLQCLAPLTSLSSVALQGCSSIEGDVEDFNKLTGLALLNVSECLRIQGDIKCLGNLKSLHSIQMAHCENVSGDIEVLGKMGPSMFGGNGLTVVDFASTPIRGDVAAIAASTNLIIVDFTDCSALVGRLQSIAKLAKLKILHLGGCGHIIGNFIQVSFLQNLVSLDFHGCQKIIGNIWPLRRTLSLERLNLSKCIGLEGDIECLKNVRRLKFVDLTECFEVEGSISSLKGHPNLITISLLHNALIRGSLGALHNMEFLSVIDCRGCSAIYVEEIDFLSTLPLLHTVDFSRSEVVGDLGSLASCNGLIHVGLSFCNIRGDLAALANKPKLKYLSLEGCRDISGNIVNLKSNTSLVHLDFSTASGVFGDIAELRDCTSLNFVEFDGCPLIAGDVGSFLSRGKKLKHLNFTNCTGLTGDVMNLSRHRRLSRVVLFRCAGVTGDLACLRGLSNLTVVNFMKTSVFGDLACFESMPVLTDVTCSQVAGLTGDVSVFAGSKKLKTLAFYKCSGVWGDLYALKVLHKLEKVDFTLCCPQSADPAATAKSLFNSVAGDLNASVLAGVVAPRGCPNHDGDLMFDNANKCRDLLYFLNGVSLNASAGTAAVPGQAEQLDIPALTKKKSRLSRFREARGRSKDVKDAKKAARKTAAHKRASATSLVLDPADVAKASESPIRRTTSAKAPPTRQPSNASSSVYSQRSPRPSISDKHALLRKRSSSRSTASISAATSTTSSSSQVSLSVKENKGRGHPI